MKKIIWLSIFFSLLSVLPSLIYSQPKQIRTKDDALRTMTQTRVFQKENLITQNLKQEEKDAWTQLLKSLKEYVQTYNKSLLEHYATIETSSSELINLLSTVYITYIVPALRLPSDAGKGIISINATHLNPLKLDARALESTLDPLRNLSSNLTRTQDALRRLTFKKASENDVKTVLETFMAFHLQPVINKVLMDFQKVEAFKIKSLQALK